MKHTFIIIILDIFLTAFCFGQKTTPFQLIKSISGDIVEFTVDNLDNIYIINSTGQIKKLNVNGDSVAVYNDVKKYGKISVVDASNPMRVLLYYKDFSTVVILDRFLNMRSTIDLRKQNIYQAKSIGLAYDNNIWVYDEVEHKLKKIDEDGKLVIETPDFRLLFNEAPVIQNIFDHDGFVYLYDTTRGIYVFDYYGSLKNKVLIKHWNNFKVIDKFIFGNRNDTLYRYEIKNLSLREQKMSAAIYPSRSVNFTTSRLYVLKNDTLEIYSLLQK